MPAQAAVKGCVCQCAALSDASIFGGVRRTRIPHLYERAVEANACNYNIIYCPAKPRKWKRVDKLRALHTQKTIFPFPFTFFPLRF